MAQIGGNFVNPAYATPAQRKAMLEYALQLQKGQPVQHWAQGLSNIVGALVGGGLERKVGEEERGAKTQYAKQLAEALRSKDPAEQIATIASPEADPLTAIIMRQLQEYGPPVSTTRTIGPLSTSVSAPIAPTAFGGGAAPVQPVQRGGGLPPPAAPTAATPRGGNLTGPDREVTGVDYGPTTFVQRYAPATGQPDIPDIPGLSPQENAQYKALQQGNVAIEEAKSRATLSGAQQQTAATQAAVNEPIQKRVAAETKAILGELGTETLANPLTGKTGYVRAQIPGTPAFNLNQRLRSLESMLGELHAQRLKATNPASRVMPQEIEDYKRGLGFDLTDRQRLIRSLNAMQGGDFGVEPPAAPAPQGAFPAQAGESSVGGPKLIKVIPYGRE